LIADEESIRKETIRIEEEEIETIRKEELELE
jgi:hypothetical protein